MLEIFSSGAFILMQNWLKVSATIMKTCPKWKVNYFQNLVTFSTPDKMMNP
jgi:hypothetical protein